ncbi:hypothetical protein DYBT9623_00320 [Dyadobacter sp. CECT 9623]|uniref:Glycosyl transferase family 28 C-terminal domain-containing protein n=1 Tax=Dyadobacter linearis TaxID=2823330 RepID=A0ABM8UJA9_9BACT|nr:glycosyltransferase [Dyadobacter sp. CECT 9623]CAG5067599.1 hypothetical protein DYBT9623_00320 [Dyadobacter sp. CECT 9623]
MRPNFAFYVHHHGSGHVMRAIAIASQLGEANVSFLGSGLHAFTSLIPPHITCYHLPSDIARDEDEFSQLAALDFLHYAPLNVRGLTDRSAVIADFFKKQFPVLLIVDVSVEVTMLAALCGIPALVIRQTGNRNDIPHLNAYQSAQTLIAPSPAALMNRSDFDWVEAKTFYSGGFSRFQGMQIDRPTVANTVAVMTGTGGTSIGPQLIEMLAAEFPDKTFHILGKMAQPFSGDYRNVVLHGNLENPAEILVSCETVIGNAGHNTVMEMADLNKRFICIYEERPFDEQLHKAKLLEANNMAVVIAGDELSGADWGDLFTKAANLPPDRWKGVINPDALTDIAGALHDQWRKLFNAK